MKSTVLEKRETIRLKVTDFDVDATLDCGQCFRWNKTGDRWHGVAFSRPLTVWQQGCELFIEGASEEEARKIWLPYFGLDADYAEIKRFLSGDEVLGAAMMFAPGLRIMRQEPWETLCSFIISQNNNIKRIRGIVARLCEAFGTPIGDGEYGFPTAATLAPLDIDDLAPLRCGFRAKYILDAARQVACGSVDLDACTALPVDEARDLLMRIKGVGPKVADCALLFGCGRLECFPVDVWIKRVLAKYYPDGFPEKYKVYGGIAQQYLFHYARLNSV